MNSCRDLNGPPGNLDGRGDGDHVRGRMSGFLRAAVGAGLPILAARSRELKVFHLFGVFWYASTARMSHIRRPDTGSVTGHGFTVKGVTAGNSNVIHEFLRMCRKWRTGVGEPRLPAVPRAGNPGVPCARVGGG